MQNVVVRMQIDMQNVRLILIFLLLSYEPTGLDE